MAKVFTITEGLENMGALRTGGQGSVYKARRNDGTITAVKLLPTPLLSESEEDKNYLDFKNEVEKLRRVNEEHNPYIVKILSAGVTDTGSFPYIEMEFIEGPDLGELLQAPHPPIFTLKEALRVAEHLSNALSHCHSLGVKHGDIKSNNIKLDTHTGNYVLLDFGLAAMSDEQRRTSLRHAGAIEFMAPEQNEGQMLFQTDVYSFGVVLFELLAGRVPYPLEGQGETARNAVMIAHMEEPLPDLLTLRHEHMPDEWSKEQKLQELQVPGWLLQLLDRCLQKDPHDRFLSAVELHDHLRLQLASGHATAAPQEDAGQILNVLQSRNEELARRNAELQQQLSTIKDSPALAATPAPLTAVATEPLIERTETQTVYSERPRRKSGLSAALLLLLVLVVGGGIAGYTLLKHDQSGNTSASQSLPYTDTTTSTGGDENYTPPESAPAESNLAAADTLTYEQSAPVQDTVVQQPVEVPETPATEAPDSSAKQPLPEKQDNNNNNTDSQNDGIGRYKVIGKAYFHNEPDESTRRNAFITHWNNAVLQPTKEQNGFVYVVFTNDEGQTSRGWIKKSDLVEVKE